MAASATDKFSKAYQRLSTTLASDKALGATSMTLASAANWPTDAGVIATVYETDANNDAVSATIVSYAGIINGSQIINLDVVEGTDQLHSAGDKVTLYLTSEHWNRAMDGILQDHDQSGQHKSLTDANGNEWIKQTATASAVNEITVANAATGSGPTISATGGDTNVDLSIDGKGTGRVVCDGLPPQTFVDEATSDFVASGCVWTADDAGTSLDGSMTAGVVYIGGKRYSIDAVTANSFTASKDTYVDVGIDGTVDYNEVANAAAAPALAADHIRLAKVVTDATDINAASSIVQTGSDSNGVSIYNTSPIHAEGWKTWTPTYGGTASMTFSSVTTHYAKYLRVGNTIHFQIAASGTTGGTASSGITFTLPVAGANIKAVHTGLIVDSFAETGLIYQSDDASTVRCNRPTSTNFTLGANKQIRASGTYEAA